MSFMRQTAEEAKSFTLSGLTVLRLVKKGGKAPEAISVRGGNRLPARFDLSGFSVSQARGNDYPARLPPEFC